MENKLATIFEFDAHVNLRNKLLVIGRKDNVIKNKNKKKDRSSCIKDFKLSFRFSV